MNSNLGRLALMAALLVAGCDGGERSAESNTTSTKESACAPEECPSSSGLQAGFTSPLTKVYRDEPVDSHGERTGATTLYMARNEYEATQLVLSSPTAIPDVSIELSLLQSESGAAPIPMEDIQVNVIGYVNLASAKVAGSRTGWLPDPLLPNQKLSLAANTPQPYLLTVHSRDTTQPGEYQGTINVRSNGTLLRQLTLRVVVWNFTLPRQSDFKSASLGSWKRIIQAWPTELGYSLPSDNEKTRRFLALADLGFRNRLPPLGFIANGLDSWNRAGQGNTDYGFPTHDRLADGSRQFNAQRTDKLIDFMLARGANHFFIALTSDIYLYPEITGARRSALLGYLRDYTDHLRRRGLLHMAYVYGVDEPWNDAVQHANDTHALVKLRIGRDVPFMQNTNQNNAAIIGRLLGHFDALDINLGFYDATDTAGWRTRSGAQLGDFWWNVNLWPATHPNLFVEFPLSDARIIGPLSYKYRIDGFEYWDLMSLNGIRDYRPISPADVLTGWTIEKNSLDGTLVYPATDLSIYSSLRLENFRDGMEDQEYLHLLEQVDSDNGLLAVPVVTSLTTHADEAAIADYRRRIGEVLNQAGLP